MSIPIPSIYVRRWFNRAFTNGEAFDYASLDVQHSDIVEAFNFMRQRINLISTANGVLTTLASTTSFTATASQTAFTVPSYDSTADTIHVYINGVRLAQASITATDDTTVTLPAQTVGAAVIIDIYTPGNGTTQLASTSNGQGASLVGINDAGGLYTATDVEGALAEAATNLASAAYLGGVLTISNYIKKDGSVAFTGNQSMGTHKITNLGAGTASSNDAARMADITSAALQSALSAYLAATYLALSGGTMTGNIAMSSNKVTGLAAATANGDAVRYNEFVAIAATQITSGLLAAARMTVMVGDNGVVAGTQGAVPAPALGDAAAAKYLKADGTWATVASNLGGYCLIRDQKASGTDGGTSIATTWTARDLNTEVVDTGSVATLSANQVTLIAGTYRVRAISTFYAPNYVTIRLRNITAGATVANGMSIFFDNSASNANCVATVTLDGRFTIAVASVFELQYYLSAAQATTGLGRAVTSGEVELYSVLELIKE